MTCDGLGQPLCQLMDHIEETLSSLLFSLSCLLAESISENRLGSKGTKALRKAFVARLGDF